MAITNYSTRARALTATALLAVTLATPGFARASIISSSSISSGEVTSLNLQPAIGSSVGIGSGPLPTTSGSGVSNYTATNSLASASVGGFLSTGLLAANASYSNPGVPLAAANATVNGVSLNLLDSLLNVLGLSATSAVSNAAVQGGYGALAATGSTVITGLSVAGLSGFGASIIPGVNDVILNALGIIVTLNKETITGNGTSAEAIAVNGIDISLTNVLATVNGTTGLLNGTIDISNSFASLGAIPDAVPEPATLALLAAPLTLLGLGLWRKRSISFRM